MTSRRFIDFNRLVLLWIEWITFVVVVNLVERLLRQPLCHFLQNIIGF